MNMEDYFNMLRKAAAKNARENGNGRETEEYTEESESLTAEKDE